MRILGTPLGTPAYAAAHAAERLAEEKRLLAELPDLPDLQCAWLLLYFSAAARTNHLLRVVPPDDIAPYAALHDDEIWNTLCSLLHVDPTDHETVAARDLGTLPMRFGGLGLRDARRTSPAAYWAAVADALPVLEEKLKPLAEFAVAQLDSPQPAASAGLRAAQEAAALLDQEQDLNRPTWERPTWTALAEGARPPAPTEAEPGEWKHG